MTMTRARPTRAWRERWVETPCEPGFDAAEISAELRDLASEAYRLVTLASRAELAPVDRGNVVERIIRLERGLDNRNLFELATYMTALRKRVETIV